MARGTNNKGRNNKPIDHYTTIIRHTMETPAWRALTSTAQALYPWIKLEWRSTQYNNNGEIRLSARQAASKLGITTDTAARAFQDLQAKGFIHITKAARLGVGGEGKSPKYEITELALPKVEKSKPRKLYLEWSEGNDFPVHKHMANNPKGVNGKTKPCPKNYDSTVIKMRMGK